MNILFFLLISNYFFSQQNFNSKILEIEGDLNKDGIKDLVILKQDTINEYHPYQLQIFLKDKIGKNSIVISANKAIEEEFPNGKNGFLNDNNVEIEIKNGIIIITKNFIRGWYSHKFRYNKNKFELIGATICEANYSNIIKTDYNLLTGNLIITKTAIGSNRENFTKRKLKINSLPDLQNFVPLSKEYY